MKPSNLIGPMYNLQMFKRIYTDIICMRGARWMVPLTDMCGVFCHYFRDDVVLTQKNKAYNIYSEAEE